MCTGMCVTEMRAKDGKRVWELPEDQERDTQGHHAPTGQPEAHASAQASARVHADAWGGNLRLKAPRSGRNGSAQRQAKRSTSGSGWEAGAGTSAPVQMSTPARAGVPIASAHPGMRGRPPHTHVYTHITQAQVTDPAPPPRLPSSAKCHVQHSTMGKEQRRPAGLGAWPAATAPWP